MGTLIFAEAAWLVKLSNEHLKLVKWNENILNLSKWNIQAGTNSSTDLSQSLVEANTAWTKTSCAS